MVWMKNNVDMVVIIENIHVGEGGGLVGVDLAKKNQNLNKGKIKIRKGDWGGGEEMGSPVEVVMVKKNRGGGCGL